MVMVEQLVAVNGAVLLQPGDDFAVIVRVVPELIRNHRRQRFHFIAYIHVALGRLFDQFLRRRVNTPVLEGILVHDRRQPVIVAGPWQYLGAYPFVVVPHLPGQRRVGLFPALQVGTGHELLDSGNERLGAFEVLLDLTAIRTHQSSVAEFFF